MKELQLFFLFAYVIVTDKGMDKAGRYYLMPFSFFSPSITHPQTDRNLSFYPL